MISRLQPNEFMSSDLNTFSKIVLIAAFGSLPATPVRRLQGKVVTQICFNVLVYVSELTVC